VHRIGALTGSLGSTAISTPVSDRMIRRLHNVDHRFIRWYYFSGKLFQQLATLARPMNMTPLRLLSYLCHSEGLQQPRREGDCVLAHLGFSSSWLRSSFLVIKVSRCIHGLVKCLGQVKVCGLVTLGDWQLLDGLGTLGVLGELLEIVGASRKLGVHGLRPTVPEMENDYS
jgi:hypothetical protein